MAIFDWDESLSVGLASVDYQHRRLVGMINALDEAVTVGSDEPALRRIIKGLYDYTEYHFSTEQEMMRAAGPSLRDHYLRHCAEHAAFTAQIRPLAQGAPLDASVLNEALFEYLVRWLTDHILGSDKDMGRLIAAAGGWAETLPTGTVAGSGGVRDDAQRSAVERNLLGALHESEARFRNLSDNIPVLISVSEVTGERVFFNRGWLDFSGIELKALQSGQWLDLVHADDRAAYEQAVQRALAERGRFLHELRLRRADGRYRWMLETTVPRFGGDGEFLGLIGSAVDITERKQAERVLVLARERLEQEVRRQTAELRTANLRLEQEKAEQQRLIGRLKEAQDQLLQSEKMASIGQLAAGVAHEINNPVGYIASNLTTLDQYAADLLRLIDSYAAAEGTLPEAQRRALQDARTALDLEFLRDDLLALIRESQEGTARVKQIVQDLKDFSHVDEAAWQWADLHRGIDSTLNVVRNEIKYKAEVVKAFGELPEVRCLPAQINQVLMNLLVNAAQAIPDKGTITIRTGQAEGWVWMEVEDTGIGIAAENLRHLFEPFFTTKPVGKGTGLGLSVSYGIVEKHGGRIEVTSRPGQGSTFRIWLPVAGPAEPDVEAPSATA
jgi:two-component system NtrC family sensor kinase